MNEAPFPCAFTVRVEPKLRAQMEVVTQIDEISLAELVRKALTEYIKSRQKDKVFQVSLQQYIEIQKAMLCTS
jgi:hypothetical protein